jgi:type VI secretion system secreted protein VgrG
MTRSTIKSRSTMKGAAENFNEIRIEDKKGEEEILIHAEKNFLRYVENNDEVMVGFDKKDPGLQKVDVYGDRTLTVEEGNQLHKIKKGNRTAEIDTGNDVTKVATGNQTVTIETGNQTVTVSKGNHELKVSAGTSLTDAMQKIELKVGSSSIVLEPGGVTIKGAMITIEATGKLDVKGVQATVAGSAMLTIQGGLVKIN